MRGPTAHARDGEDRGEQIRRNVQAVLNRGAVEIDIRVQVLLFGHDGGDALAHLNLLRFAELLG